MSFLDRLTKGSIFEDVEIGYAPEEDVAESSINRSIANVSKVDKLKGAVDSTKLSKSQRKGPTKIEKDTLKERQRSRAAKQLEQRIKLVSDLQEVNKGMQEINQAKLDFYQIDSQAGINKTLIDQEIDEIVGAGQAQAGLERAAGETASELDQLKLAAQGQRLSGEGAKAVSRSHRIMAATRAADARTNALSRAMGLELEKVAIDRQVAYGNIQKDIAYRSGFTRIAYGIADAAIRYRGGGNKERTESDTEKTSDKSKGRNPASVKKKRRGYGGIPGWSGRHQGIVEL